MSSNQIDQCRQPATCTGRCLGGQGYPDSGGSRFENAGVARAFPGLANPLEGGIDVIATAYIRTERPVWVGGEEGHLLFSGVGTVEVRDLRRASRPSFLTGLVAEVLCLIFVQCS